MNRTILFHGSCQDGTAAAWVLWEKFHREDGADHDRYLEADYSKPVPWDDIDGRQVYIVDFSYDTEVLKEIIGRSESVVMLDHHERSFTIMEETTAWAHREGISPDKVTISYNAHKSGALMTWDWAYPGTVPPAIISHISDRDLWQFKLQDTKQVMAALATYGLKLSTWQRLFAEHNDGYTVAEGILCKESAGDVAQRLRGVDIDWTLEYAQRTVDIDWVEEDGSYRGAKVPLLNCPPSITSEALGRLALDHMFAMSYFDMPQGRRFSIRSCNDGTGYNVRHVARHYGGDGHRTAAGFTVPRSHPLATL